MHSKFISLQLLTIWYHYIYIHFLYLVSSIGALAIQLFTRLLDHIWGLQHNTESSIGYILLLCWTAFDPMIYMMSGNAFTRRRKTTPISRPHTIHILKIDYFLVDKWVLQKIHNSTLNPITRSDHAPMSIIIASSTTSNPIRIWRANTQVMQSSPYAEQIQNHLTDFFLKTHGSVPHSSSLWMAH